jgi:protein-tyrosine phosphatase
VPGTLITLPCGARVRAAASYHRREDDRERGFGIYMDPHWAPSWPAEVVDWENMGLPRDFERAAAQIRRAYAEARAGKLVEVGCQAGLGRTGVVIACMAILGGLEAERAVGWVRENYVQRAVESRSQEWWVLWFAAYLRGEPAPPGP